MVCWVCRFRDWALLFRLWEQEDEYICGCHDQDLASYCVDTEMPRAPNMSPCFPEHGDSKVMSTCLLQGLCVQWEPTSVKRYTFYQPLGFYGSACYSREHGSLNIPLFSLIYRFIMWWYVALWNYSIRNQTYVLIFPWGIQHFPLVSSHMLSKSSRPHMCFMLYLAIKAIV